MEKLKSASQDLFYARLDIIKWKGENIEMKRKDEKNISMIERAISDAKYRLDHFIAKYEVQK